MGMAAGGGATVLLGLWRRRAWRYLTPVATACGIWAIVPDLPRVWREDFPSLPFSALLGQRELETWLHGIGDLFFFHHALDAQPNEYALHGMAAIVFMYNLAFVFGRLARRRRRAPTHRTDPLDVPSHRTGRPSPATTALPRSQDHDHGDDPADAPDVAA